MIINFISTALLISIHNSMQFAVHRISYSAQIGEPVDVGLSFASACSKAS